MVETVISLGSLKPCDNHITEVMAKPKGETRTDGKTERRKKESDGPSEKISACNPGSLARQGGRHHLKDLEENKNKRCERTIVTDGVPKAVQM